MRKSRGPKLTISILNTRGNRALLCVSTLGLVVLLAGCGAAVGNSNASNTSNSQSLSSSAPRVLNLSAAPPGTSTSTPDCGATWLTALQQIANLSPTRPVNQIQVLDWNNYDAGNQIEAGVDSCVSIIPAVSGNTLSWQATGNMNTIDHYAVWASPDGTNFTLVASVSPDTNSLNLATAALPQGQYTTYVQAVGRPSFLNKLSPAVGVSIGAVPAPSPASSPLSITTTDLTDPTSGVAYSATLTAAGGLSPYNWSVASGALPPGLKLSASGALAGTPSQGGSFSFTISVVDSEPVPAKASQSLTVLVASGASGKGSSQQLPVISNVAVSGITPYSATVSWNTNISTDGLVGWGLSTASYNFDSGVLDSGGATSHSYTITGLYPGITYYFFLRSRPTPGGVLDTSQQDWAIWNADGCSGICSFTTAAPPAGTFNYTLYMTGPHNVTQGYDTYVAAWLVPTQGAGPYPGVSYTANSLTITLSGLPPYTSLQWTQGQQWGIGANPASDNSLSFYGFSTGLNGYDIHLSTNQGGTTPDGGTACTSAGGTIISNGCQYTLTIIGSGTGVPTKRVEWKLNVNAPGFAFRRPSYYPAIPCLASASTMMDGRACSYNWADTMNTYGQFWCPEDTDFSQTGMCSTNPAPIGADPARCLRANDSSHLVPVGGNQTQAWYYDGDLVYEQIGNYLGNPSKWAQCVNNFNQVYRDGYVIANNGGIPGYILFTEGLYRDYLQNRTANDLKAIDDLVNNAAFNFTFNAEFSQTNTQREAAYRLQADLWGSSLDNPTRWGHPASYWLQYDVAHVIGQIEQQCTQNQPYEYFMTGLQAEALIKYYIATGSTDIRIPPAIKQLADCVWTSGWDKTADDPYAFPYSSPGPIYGFSMAGAYGGGSLENLNLLIAPMYAWLYSITGDSTYQTEGDTIWQYGVTMPTSGGIPATIGWTGNGGKQFSQNYRWSFNYVTWRSSP